MSQCYDYMYSAYIVITKFNDKKTFYHNSHVCGAQINVLFVCCLCPLPPWWIFQALLCWFHAFQKLFTAHHGSLDMTEIHFIQQQKFITSELRIFKTDAHVKLNGEEGQIRSEVQLLIVIGTACPLLGFDAVNTTNVIPISMPSLYYWRHCICHLDFITVKRL